MSFSNFKVLTFDVVGTLIDFETGVLDAVRKTSGKKRRRTQRRKISNPTSAAVMRIRSAPAK